MDTPLFEEKTGRFVGLNPEQLAALNPAQRAAYDALADATTKLAEANAEFEAARENHYAAVRALQEAETEAKKRKPWTHMDEWRAMKAAGDGLPTDKDLLKQAIAKCQLEGVELSEQNIKAHLPPNFVLEIDDGTKASEPTLYDLQEALSETHVRMHESDQRMRGWRARVAECITAWQVANNATPNFESLVRQHIQSENAERARRVANGESRPTSRPGRSEIDRYAFVTRNSGKRAGGGSGFRRGGVSANEAMRLNRVAEITINRLRQQQKLPSER